MCTRVLLHDYMPLLYGCLRCPEDGAESLVLELQVVVSCLLWVLGTQLRFPGRTAWTLNHPTISLVPFDKGS